MRFDDVAMAIAMLHVAAGLGYAVASVARSRINVIAYLLGGVSLRVLADKLTV